MQAWLPDTLRFIGAVLVAGVTGWATYKVAVISNRTSSKKIKTDARDKQVDQLQEDVAGLRAELKDTRNRLDRAETVARKRIDQVEEQATEQVAQSRGRAQLLEDYAAQLRRHIEDQKGPPPLPWPPLGTHRPS